LAQDPEKMKAMIAFKKRLEDRLEKLNGEVAEVQATLDTVNTILLERGFKRGDIKEVPTPSPSMPKEVVLPKQEPEPPKVVVTQQPIEQETVIPLRTMNDENLAIMHVDKQIIHIYPDETKHFNVNTPPFGNFLVEKVFAKMQEKDKELVRLGQLTTDKMFSYNIIREQDLIREIVLKNVDDERLKELKSSVRWTFEKMYEKMKGA
jgi:ribosomal protein L11